MGTRTAGGKAITPCAGLLQTRPVRLQRRDHVIEQGAHAGHVLEVARWRNAGGLSRRCSRPRASWTRGSTCSLGRMRP
ncbi:Hypothetical protein AA314_08726 [Archangium gephyra]|uniref:Uncharacterized protein n=1 Tax=Archangium gephyra TaxID=48 RepID=A0AAC8QHA8_9BACT|nr:Hypothetical protein AA314_08726 [Archangium gephyra]